MYGDDGPDDDYMTVDQAMDGGWLCPDDVTDLRDMLALTDLTPVPGDRALAVLLLINHKLNPPAPYLDDVAGPMGTPKPLDPHILWAERLLDFKAR